MTNKTETANQTSGADTHKFKMKPNPGTPPGMEVDSKGNPIPLAERTEDDQEKARKAKTGKSEDEVTMKNPDQEAEHPSPMPHHSQGKGGGKGGSQGNDKDPAGHQGGNR